MERNHTEESKNQVHGRSFMAVTDSRKRKVRGLVTRNGKYYVQMRLAEPGKPSRPVRIPIEASDLPAAIAEAERVRTSHRAQSLPTPGHRPSFASVVVAYQESAEFAGKKRGTQKNEEQALARWSAQLGNRRVDWITVEDITAFQDARVGVTARTKNLDTTALNNALRYAQARGWVATPPRKPKLKEAPPRRRQLVTREQVDAILAAAPKCTKNHFGFSLYIRFLVASGAREKEALRLRRTDLDFSRGVVHVGSEGDSKNRRPREIHMNNSLRVVCNEIAAALPPDTSWLFPSPQRGQKDIHTRSFRESLRLCRSAANLPWLGFHDFRHYFASQCVMAGIDYMTIAKWLGHQDGGILVGKVYGHLNDEHQRKAAEKLSL